MRTEPWSKFYWADWRSDTNLRMCSLGARGLWMELLGIMHDSSEYGHLLINGKAPTDQQLAVMCGATVGELRKCRAELQGAGVPGINKDGTWFSRRMVRDLQKRIRDKENGAKGGNPMVKGSVKPGVNPPVEVSDKGEVKEGDKARATRDPEARSQKPEEKLDRAVPEDAAPPASIQVIAAFDAARVEVFGEVGRREFPSADDCVFAERFLAVGAGVGWLKSLFLERMAKRKQAGSGPPDGLKYFEKAVPEALQRIATAKAPPQIQGFQPREKPVERTPEQQAEHDAKQREWHLRMGKQHPVYNPEGITAKEACA